MKYPRGRFFITYEELFKILIGTITSLNIFKDSNAIKSLKNFFKTDNLTLCPSYRIGLYHTLKNLNLNKGDEVVLTPITIPDTINSITMCYLKPTFIDHDKETHNIDINDFKKVISSKTKVLILTYLSGITGNAQQIRELCTENNIILIEDFSQAYGSRIAKSQAGRIGDISIGSLSSGKTISSLFGGVIICPRKELLEQIETSLNQHSKSKSHQIFMLLFQIMDNFKVNILCSKHIFNYFTFYLLLIIKKRFPSTFNKVEQSRSIARFINKDIYFEDSHNKRDSFPSFFYYNLKAYQHGLICSMLERLDSSNKKRRENFLFLKSLLDKDIVDNFIPRGLLSIEENVYYHIPFHSPINLENIQSELLSYGVDVSTYGLPDCSKLLTLVQQTRELPNTHHLKRNTFFVPIFENHSKKEITEMARKLNRVLSPYSK